MATIKQLVTVSSKFASSAIFIAYAKQLSGYSFDEVAMANWYDTHLDFVMTYTGMFKELTPFVTGVLTPHA